MPCSNSITVTADNTTSSSPILSNWSMVSCRPLKALIKILVSQRTISAMPVAFPGGGAQVFEGAWVVFPDPKQAPGIYLFIAFGDYRLWLLQRFCDIHLFNIQRLEHLQQLLNLLYMGYFDGNGHSDGFYASYAPLLSLPKPIRKAQPTMRYCPSPLACVRLARSSRHRVRISSV